MHVTYKNGLKMSKYEHTGLLTLAIPPHLLQTTEQACSILLRGGFNNAIPKTVFPMNFSQKIFTKLFYYLYI